MAPCGMKEDKRWLSDQVEARHVVSYELYMWHPSSVYWSSYQILFYVGLLPSILKFFSTLITYRRCIALSWNIALPFQFFRVTFVDAVDNFVTVSRAWTFYLFQGHEIFHLPVTITVLRGARAMRFYKQGL
jgi:hypothetical protein